MMEGDSNKGVRVAESGAGSSSGTVIADQSDVDEMDPEDDTCELCLDVQEILSRPHSGPKDLYDVELSRDDAESIFRFFDRPHEHKDCAVFEQHFWEVHRLLRTFVVQVIIPMMNSLVEDYDKLLRVSELDFDSDGEVSDSRSDYDDLDMSIDGTPRLRQYSMDERASFIGFAASVFSEDFMLYRSYTRESESDQSRSSNPPKESNRQTHPLLVLMRCAVEHKILEALEGIFGNDVTVVPVKVASKLLKIMVEIRKFTSKASVLTRKIQDIRRNMIRYLCSMAENDQEVIRDPIFRIMSDSLWTIGREETLEEGQWCLDESGIELAVKHCDSPYLASRIAGLHQICHYIQTLQDCLTNDNMDVFELMAKELARVLSRNDVVGLLFGPNTHPEVLKQAFPFLDFMALWSVLTPANIDCIWSAAQKKDCSKHVFELLSLTVKNMDPRIVSYLHSILQDMSCSEHSELSLALTYNVIDILWRMALLRAQFGLHLKQGREECGDKLADTSGESGLTSGTSSGDPEFWRRKINGEDMSSDVAEEDMEMMMMEQEETEEGTRLSTQGDGLLEFLEQNREAGTDGDSASERNSPISPLMREAPESGADPGNKARLKRPSQNEKTECEPKKKKLESSRDGMAEPPLMQSTPNRRKNSCSLQAPPSSPIQERKSCTESDTGVPHRGIDEGLNRMILLDKFVINRAEKEMGMPDDSLDMSSDRATSSGAGSDRLVDMEEEDDDEEFDGMNLSVGFGDEVASEEDHPGIMSGQGSFWTENRPLVHSGIDRSSVCSQMRQRNLVRACCSDVDLPDFNLSRLAAPKGTIFWDLLLHDDKNDCLGAEEECMAMKLLMDLCDNFPNARTQFMLACVENLRRYRSAVVSLQLLPRLMEHDSGKINSSSDRSTTSKILARLDMECDLMDLFYGNLKAYFQNGAGDATPSSKYPHGAELQARMRFLDFVYNLSDHPHFVCLKLEQFAILWKCMMGDKGFGRHSLCQWMLSQLKRAEKQHAAEALAKMILDTELVDFDAETLMMTELTLIQTLLNFERADSDRCLRLLWHVFLSNCDTNVSMAAMQGLSSYYVSSRDPTDAARKEEEFVRLCTEHLESALSCAQFDRSLPIINRALVMLKSHLEIFKRRFSYHLRMRELDVRAEVSHHRNARLDRGSMMTVFFQTGTGDKNQLLMAMTDTLGELRAEVTCWWKRRYSPRISPRRKVPENVYPWKEMESDGPPPNVTISRRGIPSSSQAATPLLGALLADAQIRLIFGGRELNPDLDEVGLLELGIRDGSTILVGLSNPKGNGSTPKGFPIPPEFEFTPMKMLLVPHRWNLLMRVIDQLLSQSAGTENDLRSQCLNLARGAWDVIMLLPTSSKYLGMLDDVLMSDTVDARERKEQWTALLDDTRKHQLLYVLQILEPRLIADQQIKRKFVQKGGANHLLWILLSGSLFPKENEWNEWDMDCVVSVLRVVYCCSVVPDESGTVFHCFSRRELQVSREQQVTSCLLDLSVFEEASKVWLVALLQNLISRLCDDSPCYFTLALNLRITAVVYAFMLLTSLMYTEPDLQQTFLEYSDFKGWLKLITFKSSENALRQECASSLYRLCLGRSAKKAFAGKSLILPVLSGLISSLEEAASLTPLFLEDERVKKEENKESCGPSSYSYFFLVTNLVEGLKRADVEFPMDLLAAADRGKELLFNRPHYEQREVCMSDPGLRGLIMLLSAIAKQHSEWKSSESGTSLCCQLWDMLFLLPSVTNKEEPKCKAPETRLAAYDLLIELCKESPGNFRRVYVLVTRQNSKTFHEDYGWDYWPRDDKRSVCGFVGLTNLGATCYMATALQHLYMIPQFRSAVLGFQQEQTQKHITALVELQKLFAFLLESKRKAYSPRNFCKVYRMEHQPMNTAEQKDMTEFFTDLITKTEEMSPDLRKVVKRLFCGVMSNNVVSDSCPHVSKTTEEFYTVRCQVANMKDIYASLDELTVADTLDGDNMYTCSQCNRKVKAKKRACFKELPQILSFNTMRYTFNMITMMKEKVNTHFSFPHKLNMEPYMEETLLPLHASRPSASGDGVSCAEKKPVSYLYQLIGVTVHTGTAEGGHYYSYIRDPANTDKWYSFNDAEVKDWDVGNLPSECFGGEMTVARHHFETHMGESRHADLSYEKANSAYMVYYERLPLPSAVPSESNETKVELSTELAEYIWEDNVRFLQDVMLFDHQYINFVHQLCSEVPGTLRNVSTVELAYQTAQLSLRFVLETLIHAKEKPTIQTWIELLLKQLSGCHAACEWFLETMIKDHSWPLELLIKCPSSGCRQLFEKLISHVFIELHDKHEPLYLEGTEFSRSPELIEADEVGQNSCVTRFIRVLLDLLLTPDIGTQVRQLAEYFSLLLTFSKGGAKAGRFLLLAGAIRTVVGFYMSKTNEELAEEESLIQTDDSDLSGLLSLVRSASISAMTSLWLSAGLQKMIDLVIVLLESSREVGGKFQLHKADRAAVFGGKNYAFMMQQIKDAPNGTVSARLLLSVSKDQPVLKQKLVETIFANIEKLTREDQISQFFFTLSELCAVDGECTKDDFLGLTLSYIWSLAERRSVLCLNWLENNATHCPKLYAYLLNNMDYWVVKHLLDNINSQARSAAGQLLLSLIPCSSVRSTYVHYHRTNSVAQPRVQNVPTEAMGTLHKVYEYLLNLMPKAMMYADPKYSHARLVSYFTALRACLIGRDEKRMVVPHVNQMWLGYRKFIHSLHHKVIPNKQAMFTFWYFASMDCPELVEAALNISDIFKSIFHCYIEVSSDRDSTSFNKQYLTAFYGLIKLFCAHSEQFSKEIMTHENLGFAVTEVACKTGDYRQASEDIVGILELCCKVKNQALVKKFKQHVVWELMRKILNMSSSHFLLVLKVIRFIVETPEDKMFLLENDVLNILSDIFINVHKMYHEATACNVVGDMCELLKRFEDFLTRVEQCGKVFGQGAALKILSHWDKPVEVATKLLQLLNAYVPPELRRLSVDCLSSMVRLLSSDTKFTKEVILVVIAAHKRWLNGPGCNPNLGPYFPKRGYIPDPRMKVHPPEPMLDMSLHSMQLECAKGVDPAYDEQLLDYFLPYHHLIDTIMRSAINSGNFPNLLALADISARIGVEGIQLQLALFPKMWLDIKEQNAEGREMETWLNALYMTDSFKEFISIVLTQEHTCLTNQFYLRFFQEFFPKAMGEIVSKHTMRLAFENVKDCLTDANISWVSADENKKIQLCFKISGALRVVELMGDCFDEEMMSHPELVDPCASLLTRMKFDALSAASQEVKDKARETWVLMTESFTSLKERVGKNIQQSTRKS